MTRIVAGRWGGRRLQVPKSGLRPTSERVREALANRVEHLCGGIAGLRVLDLYAGSGAVGLELLSRGATEAVFVEDNRTALESLRRNVSQLAGAQGRVLAVKATNAAVVLGGGDRTSRADSQPFDIVFADPPYDLPPAVLADVLGSLVETGLTRHRALLVAETARRAQGSPWPESLVESMDSRDYGDTRVWYGRVNLEVADGMG